MRRTSRWIGLLGLVPLCVAAPPRAAEVAAPSSEAAAPSPQPAAEGQPAAPATPPPAAPAPDLDAEPVAVAPPASGQGSPFSFGDWESDEPLSIESEELEAVQKDGRRRLVFRKHVRVKQGELSMRSARLEAIYPEDAGQPDRLVASGQVQLARGDQEAHCDRAVYDRVGKRLRCEGNARFRDGDNRLAGSVIEIDLADETVTVTGGASVLIQPDTLGSLRREEALP